MLKREHYFAMSIAEWVVAVFAGAIAIRDSDWTIALVAVWAINTALADSKIVSLLPR